MEIFLLKGLIGLSGGTNIGTGIYWSLQGNKNGLWYICLGFATVAGTLWLL